MRIASFAIVTAAVAAAVTGLLAIADAAPAAALTGSEKLACDVGPSPTPQTPIRSFCANQMDSSSYGAVFQVLNEAGAYSYSWTVPAAYTDNIVSGCNSVSDYCALTLVPGDSASVSVTITQSGQSATLTAVATIRAYCGSVPCRQ